MHGCGNGATHRQCCRQGCRCRSCTRCSWCRTSSPWAGTGPSGSSGTSGAARRTKGTRLSTRKETCRTESASSAWRFDWEFRRAGKRAARGGGRLRPHLLHHHLLLRQQRVDRLLWPRDAWAVSQRAWEAGGNCFSGGCCRRRRHGASGEDPGNVPGRSRPGAGAHRRTTPPCLTAAGRQQARPPPTNRAATKGSTGTPFRNQAGRADGAVSSC